MEVQGTKVRYVRVNTLVTPPPKMQEGAGGIKPTEKTYVRDDSRKEEAVSHVVGGSLRSFELDGDNVDNWYLASGLCSRACDTRLL